MKRTTISLPDDLHSRLKREAAEARLTLSELIRARLQAPASERRRKEAGDPLAKMEGIISDGSLTKDIDQELYGIWPIKAQLGFSILP